MFEKVRVAIALQFIYSKICNTCDGKLPVNNIADESIKFPIGRLFTIG